MHLLHTDLLLMCWMLPRHLNSPFTMMVSLVHSASHSSILREIWSYVCITHTQREREVCVRERRRGRGRGREGVPVSCEYNAPSLSSDSSENVPQIATSSWVHTCSWLILRGGKTHITNELSLSIHHKAGMTTCTLHTCTLCACTFYACTNPPVIEWEDLQSRQWQC